MSSEIPGGVKSNVYTPAKFMKMAKKKQKPARAAEIGRKGGEKKKTVFADSFPS